MNNELSVIIETRSFASALSFANSVVDKKNIVPELNNIRLLAVDNSLTIYATDMSLYLSQKLDANILSNGDITVSANILFDIVKKIPDNTTRLIFNLKTHQLEVLGENCYFMLPTLPSNQFPIMEQVNSDISFNIVCKNFIKMIELTQFSISLDENRYNFHGLYLHLSNGVLYAVTTDGHRLSLSSNAIDNNLNYGVIIPKKTVDEIIKIIKDNKNLINELTICMSINKIKFICNNIIMLSRLIDANFPDYNNFIPINHQNKLIINAKMFLDVIERVSIVTVDKFKAIVIKFLSEYIEVSAFDITRGSAKELIHYSKKNTKNSQKTDYVSECEYYGNIINIGLNPKYLIDVLSVLKDQKIVISIQDSTSPVLLKPYDSNENLFVIMPMQI